MKEVLFITTYPPRECGIATFSDDLINAIHRKFAQNFVIRVCALESTLEKHTYPAIVKYKLNSSEEKDFVATAAKINTDPAIELVCIQHEFGLFNEQKEAFIRFLEAVNKPIVLVFHTVLPQPKASLQTYLQRLIKACSAIVVMTQTSSGILQKEYQIDADKISVIPHGTHLVSQMNKRLLKEKYGFAGKKILSTFGLLSQGKSIETTLEALPAIVKENPSVVFLVIGKTHPTVVKAEGESYREMLKAKTAELKLTEHVRFVNFYLDLPVLLEYLQMTDIYLFTSSDPNQAVSGTFVYALSCGCPIIATPIPHALELLRDNTGIIFDFNNSEQLAKAANSLLSNEKLRAHMGVAGMQKTASTAWENSAIAYAWLFKKTMGSEEELIYSLPIINAKHIKRMSRHAGMVQFAKGNRPDMESGYTLDDNARALIALCNVYVHEKDLTCEKYIKRYLEFIKYCVQEDGSLKNYVDKFEKFTAQNEEVLLEDSNGRAVWALGYFIYYGDSFLYPWTTEAVATLRLTFPMLRRIQSPRSLAFALKGLCYFYRKEPSEEVLLLIQTLADKLIDLYKLTADENWKWFEPYLTYDNAILPECLLYAYDATKNEHYKEVAKESFDFLLGKIFVDGEIKVISNQGWLQKEKGQRMYGEQPVDVAGTVMALSTFYRHFHEADYLKKQGDAFSWFLGNNHLLQIVYNPATGGCYDGLEENNINLNQGAESSVCYLMARLSLINLEDVPKATATPQQF
ncbi:MAG: glycosyltransferase [Bacteroidaceae bacterium]